MALCTKMQVTGALQGDQAPSLVTINTHPTPVVDGYAMVLNADVTAAQALGWISMPQAADYARDPVSMQPPKAMAVAAQTGTLPDGTSLAAANYLPLPPNETGGSPVDSVYEAQYLIPQQWRDWLAKQGWMLSTAPRM